MDKLSLCVSNIYALLLIVGGGFGYLKAHSKVSFFTGVASGLLVFLACQIGKNNLKAGYLYIASISLVLAEFFCFRFASTHALMPAGLMLILSTLTYVLVARGWLKS